MSRVIFQAGAYVLLAKYIYQNKGVWSFNRRIPDDVAKHYPGRNGVIRFSLKTKDKAEAARQANRHALMQNAQWKALRTGEVASGPELVRTALGILQRFDLKPTEGPLRDELGIDPDDFLRELDYQAGLDPNGRAEENNYRMRDDLPKEYKLAVDYLYGTKPPFFLSEALNEFQRLKGEEKSESGSEDKSRKDRRRVVSDFISMHGDLPIEQYNRDHVNGYVQNLLERGNKTTTVKRRLNSISAIFSLMRNEGRLEKSSVFERVLVPKHEEDLKKVPSFTEGELHILQSRCVEMNDDIRWAIALLSDSGARLAEVVGLKVEDIFLNQTTPYFAIQPNEARRLKNAQSRRRVPLVGAAMWAAQRSVDAAKSEYLFPRYIDIGSSPHTHKANGASGTFNKWIEGKGIEKTCHSFRHGATDRLRNVGAPWELIRETMGWKPETVGAGYGDGYSLEKKAEYLQHIVLKDLFSGASD